MDSVVHLLEASNDLYLKLGKQDDRIISIFARRFAKFKPPNILEHIFRCIIHKFINES